MGVDILDSEVVAGGVTGVSSIGELVMVITISNEEAESFIFGLGSPGVCISCGYCDEYAGCEPDAREYECPNCGESKLYGLEEAMMMGLIEIADE